MVEPILSRQGRSVLGKVSAQLRSMARASLVPPTLVDGVGMHCPSLAAGLLISADELDSLEQRLGSERGRARRLELELLEARFALARSRASLLRLQSCVREARQRAMEDGLTLLPNQAALRQILDSSLHRAEQAGSALAVLYLDLDRFKSINDTHGHEVGDTLLRVMAARLRAALRAGDTVGRLGGDEFACLLVNVPGRRALARRVKQLGQVLVAPVAIGPAQLEVRASIGIAVWPEDGRTGQELLRHADQAMYTAKRQRCGQAFFDPECNGYSGSAWSPSTPSLQTHPEADHELEPYTRQLEAGERPRQGALGEAH